MDNKIGQFVSRRRKEMKLSLREFGKLCGMSHTHIDSIEKGFDVRTGREINLTSTTISKLAQALGVTESELVGGKNTVPASDSQLKLALFGDSDMPDSALDEVKRFATFIKEREGHL